MKIYWLMGPVWGVGGSKCFFLMTREKAQEEVDCRTKDCNSRWYRDANGLCKNYMSKEDGKNLPSRDWHEVDEIYKGTEEEIEAYEESVQDERIAAMDAVTHTRQCPMKPGVCYWWKEEKWYVQEEEVPDERFGRCGNCLKEEDAKPVLPEQPQCSVGLSKAVRYDIKDDDGTCGTCHNYTGPKLPEDKFRWIEELVKDKEG